VEFTQNQLEGTGRLNLKVTDYLGKDEFLRYWNSCLEFLRPTYRLLEAENLTAAEIVAALLTSAHPETCIFSQFSSPLEVGLS